MFVYWQKVCPHSLIVYGLAMVLELQNDSKLIIKHENLDFTIRDIQGAPENPSMIVKNGTTLVGCF